MPGLTDMRQNFTVYMQLDEKQHLSKIGLCRVLN